MIKVYNISFNLIKCMLAMYSLVTHLYVLSLHVSRSTLEVRQYAIYMCAMFIDMYSPLLPRKKNHFAMGHVVMMVLFYKSMEFASRLYHVKSTHIEFTTRMKVETGGDGFPPQDSHFPF